jgi:hypothetical protein
MLEAAVEAEEVDEGAEVEEDEMTMPRKSILCMTTKTTAVVMYDRYSKVPLEAAVEAEEADEGVEVEEDAMMMPRKSILCMTTKTTAVVMYDRYFKVP